MKRLLLAVALSVSLPFAAPVASAAPPSEAQIDTLMRTMDMPKMIDGILVEMDKMSEQMGLMFLPENASESDRAQLEAMMAEQREITRRALSWEKIGPMYRRIYSQLLTAEEVQAMIDFYSTEHGRSILHKTPKAMELAAKEMQPIVQTLAQDMQRSFEQRAAKRAEAAQSGD